MDDDEILTTAGRASGDPDDGQTDLSGADDGDGADEHDQGSGGEGGNPSQRQRPATDKSNTDDDDGEDLLAALADGSMDDLDDTGAKKPKDEADGEDEDPADDADPKDEEPKDEPKGDKKPEDDADKDLTPEEKAELEQAPKGQRKGMKRLFAERKELRTQVETVKAEAEKLKPAKKFADDVFTDLVEAGLVTVDQASGKPDFAGFKALLATERRLAGKPPREIADYYRRMADQIDPHSRPVKLSQDLSDQVTSETLSQEEAESIQRQRDAKANPPAEDKADRRDQEERERESVRVREERQRANEAAQQTALGEISELLTAYGTRYGEEFAAIKAEVIKNLRPLVKEAAPKLWKSLAEKEIKLVIAERKVPLKKPTKTPPSNPPKTRRADETLSEEEEADALAEGRL